MTHVLVRIYEVCLKSNGTGCACVSYGRKRDKRIVLSSNMISSEYITVILAFWNHAFVYTSSHAESLHKNGAKAAE